MAKVPLKPTGPKLTVATKRAAPVKAAHSGIKPKSVVTNQKKNAETLLDKVKRAEQELASIRSSDPNAKHALARMKSEQIRVDSNDTEFYIAVCFESYAQKVEFLEKVGLLRDDQDTYYSGHEVAGKMGVRLTKDHRAFHSLPVNRRWKRFAMPLPGTDE